MKQWIQNNWLKFIVVAVSLIIAIEVFFALYPYALNGYQLYKAHPLSQLLFPSENSELNSEPKAINPFEKQP